MVYSKEPLMHKWQAEGWLYTVTPSRFQVELVRATPAWGGELAIRKDNSGVPQLENPQQPDGENSLLGV